jgi:stage II sporulation protein AA (anti-sigma F factor antagonist)
MGLSIERSDGILIAMADGRVDGANAQEFQGDLTDAIDPTDRGVVLDLGEITYISSAGLRVILLMARALKRQDAELAVCSLSAPIREVFEISGFDKIIPVCESRPDAIASFKT